MSRSEFRWNKKRKHYAYLFKDIGNKSKNILISSKPFVLKHKNGKIRIIAKNILLVRHPNKKKRGSFYVIPIVYIDDITSFDVFVYDNWAFDINDKRRIKRIKKMGKISK